VAFPGSGAGGNFFEQILGDLLNLMGPSSGGGNRIELARSLAQSVATGGGPEGNVDPVERMQFEQLAHVAELHVAELTGLPVTPTGAAVEVAPVGPGTWAWETVDEWAFLLDAMAGPSGAAAGPVTAEAGGGTGAVGGGEAGGGDEGLPPSLGLTDIGGPLETGAGAGPADLVARWMSTMGPMLTAMQLGSAVGHLARRTMGPYELPVPRTSPRLLVVPANATRFADDWSLPSDEVRLWVCLREITAHAVLSRPHVAGRLRDLLRSVVGGMAEEAAGLMDRLQGMDLTDPESLEGFLGDPTALMTEPSPARRRAADDLMAVVVAILGYVEHVLDLAAARLLGGRGAIAEAWRRRQVDREPADRAAEVMLGLDLGPAQVDRGVAFVRGVHERAGDAGLARLWSAPRTLPTPAEVDAPGLWLERIALSDDAGD